jgi:hypothetical protein
VAGKSKTTEGKEPTGKEIRLASVQTMRAFNEAQTDADNEITDARDILKKATDEAKKKHLNIPAFKQAKKLYDGFKTAEDESKAADKLARWLAHFDEARKFYKLDELANLQGRMFGTGEIGGGEARPSETDEHGEQDLRPRHLRQPGASVTNAEPSATAADAVKALAAKAGASTSTPRPDEDALKNVGRGRDPKLN